MNLVNHVCQPTHEKGHTLYLVISREGELQINEIHVESTFPSGQWAVIFKVIGLSPGYMSKTVAIRKWKQIDLNKFQRDLISSELNDLGEVMDCDDLLTLYNRVLLELIDKHAPCKVRNCKIRQDTPWYNEDVMKAKVVQKNMERRWRKTRSDVDYEQYKQTKIKVTPSLERAKRQYFKFKFDLAKNQR